MFGKLIKYEWKSSGKMVLLLNLYIILITIIGIIYVNCSGIMKNGPSDNDFITPLLLMFYFISLIAVGIGITILLSIKIYKSLYMDEAYLTHTLPVTTHTLLLSKFLYVFVMMLFTGLIIALSSMTLVFSGDPTSFIDLFADVNMICAKNSISIAYFWFLILFYTLVSFACGVLAIFASMAGGQLFGNHRKFGSIISYIIIYVANQMIGFIFLLILQFSNVQAEAIQNNFSFMNRTFLSSVLISLVECVLLYFFTHWIISKKLNLE